MPSHYHQHTRYLLRTSPTLLYLSFAKLLHTLVDIVKIHSVTLIRHASSKIDYYGSNDEAVVWYYNGEAYGQGIHGLLLA